MWSQAREKIKADIKKKKSKNAVDEGKEMWKYVLF